MVLAIDTLTVARKLEGAGFERRQAEACVEAMRDTVVTGFSDLATQSDLGRFATKEDFGRFATKEDLERFATKEDLARALEKYATKEDLERFATKEDLARALGRFATKEDLARALERYATKEELAHFEKRMVWMWAVSTVSLAGLIVAMPFVAG